MSDRARYLEALKTERAMVAQRPSSPAQLARLEAIDAAIDAYAEKPLRRRIEKAAGVKQTAAKI